MQTSIEEKIKADLRSGKDEDAVRKYIDRQKLNKDDTQYLLGLIDDEIAIQKLRDVRKSDANLIVYLGYFLMALAIFFGIYSLAFGASIFVIGFIVARRGRNKVAEAMDIESIDELLPDHPTKFHKRRI